MDDDGPISRGRGVRAVDVARAAGVSSATVSRAFNEPDKVAPDVRERVHMVARRIGWLPHGAGSALARRRSLLMGAIIPTLASGIFAAHVTAMQRVCATHRMTLLLGVSNHDPLQAKNDVEAMLARGVEALALVGTAYGDDLFDLIRARDVPYVVTHGYRPSGPHPTIGIDNFTTFYRIAEHLLDLGHRRIGMICPPRHNNERVADRVAGVFSALAERGLGLRPQHFAEGVWSPAFGRNSLREILAAPGPRPTAVICGNDQIAFGALVAARDAELDIPGDLSITGFDDDPLSALMQPPLTTWRVDNAELGRLAAEALLARLGGEAPNSICLMAEARLRSTTGPAPDDLPSEAPAPRPA